MLLGAIVKNEYIRDRAVLSIQGTGNALRNVMYVRKNVTRRGVHLSECPRDFPGCMWSRMRCFCVVNGEESIGLDWR